MIGVGHPMRGDDYVGSFIVKTLMKGIRTDRVIFFDAEESIEWTISKLAKTPLRRVVVVDACEMNLPAGEIVLVPLADTDYPFFTTHGIPLKLLAGKLLPNVHAFILAIQPGRMGLNARLSPAVFASANLVSQVIGTILWEVESGA
jgi:hydrogenase maturation protease